MGGPRWFEENQSRFSGELLRDEPLARHTYYRIGGPASLLALPRGREDLAWLAQGIRETGVPVFVLGAGSNLLASDQGFEGLVVRAGRVNLGISRDPKSQEGAPWILTGGSVAISTLLRRAAREGWGGLEFLSGVPGSVGGAIVMNAGTHLGETSGAVRRVETVLLTGSTAGESLVFTGDQLKYQYRKNLFLPPCCVIWEACWEVRPDDPTAVKAAIDGTLARRKATQPIDYPSCGSVFKNPRSHGLHAWQVLDRLGLRGHRIGNAQIAEKHSNFIINLGKAKAADVKALIDLAKSRALSELGIPLEEEVMYLGRF